MMPTTSVMAKPPKTVKAPSPRTATSFATTKHPYRSEPGESAEGHSSEAGPVTLIQQPISSVLGRAHHLALRRAPHLMPQLDRHRLLYRS